MGRSMRLVRTRLMPRGCSAAPACRKPLSTCGLFCLRSHVLVCPRREVKRFIDLTPEEMSDLWLTAQKLGGRLKKHCDTLAIRDGPHAGQTVPHVHIHMIPRRANDFGKNGEIYDAMDVKEKELKDKLDLDKDRKDRTMGEMAEEADQLRALFL